jgi:hypothetical protein
MAPPLLLSARLHVQTADVVFTHLRAQGDIISKASGTAAPAWESLPRDELCLHLDEAVVRVSTVYIPPPPAHLKNPYAKAGGADNSRNSVTCAISISEVQVWEAYSETAYAAVQQLALQSSQSGSARSPPARKQVILSFHSLQDSRRIYASPHINVSVDYLPAGDKSAVQTSPTDRRNCASIKASVNFEPIVASTSVAMIEHWIQSLSGFPLISVAEEESSTNIACSVNLVQLELFLHSDNRPENYRAMSIRSGQSDPKDASGGSDAHAAYWDTVLDALDLAQHPEAWISLYNTSPSSAYYEHLVSTRGGFRFLLADISIKLATAARPRNKTGAGLGDSSVLGGSSLSSAERRACKANSAEALFQAVEMSQVALYVYTSLPTLPTITSKASVGAEDRRRFYCTLLVKASADETGQHKVVISRTNPNAPPASLRQPSEDAQDDDFVLLKDAYRTAPSVPTAAPAPAPDRSSSGAGKSSEKAGGTPAPGTDAGPSAPTVNPSNLIFVSAYHIQVGKCGWSDARRMMMYIFPSQQIYTTTILPLTCPYLVR